MNNAVKNILIDTYLCNLHHFFPLNKFQGVEFSYKSTWSWPQPPKRGTTACKIKKTAPRKCFTLLSTITWRQHSGWIHYALYSKAENNIWHTLVFVEWLNELRNEWLNESDFIEPLWGEGPYMPWVSQEEKTTFMKPIQLFTLMLDPRMLSPSLDPTVVLLPTGKPTSFRLQTLGPQPQFSVN